MVTCPTCGAEIEVEESDVDRGDLVSCPECGSNLEVTSLSPLELDVVQEEGEAVFEDEDETDVEGEESGE